MQDNLEQVTLTVLDDSNVAEGIWEISVKSFPSLWKGTSTPRSWIILNVYLRDMWVNIPEKCLFLYIKYFFFVNLGWQCCKYIIWTDSLLIFLCVLGAQSQSIFISDVAFWVPRGIIPFLHLLAVILLIHPIELTHPRYMTLHFLLKLHEVSVSPPLQFAMNSPWASGGLIMSHHGGHWC